MDPCPDAVYLSVFKTQTKLSSLSSVPYLAPSAFHRIDIIKKKKLQKLILCWLS